MSLNEVNQALIAWSSLFPVLQDVHHRQEGPGDHHREPEQPLLNPGQLQHIQVREAAKKFFFLVVRGHKEGGPGGLGPTTKEKGTFF